MLPLIKDILKPYQGPITDHFNGKKFFNKNYSHKNLKDIFYWLMTQKRSSWPSFYPITPSIPPSNVAHNEIAISFVNHSTFLIQIGKTNILTDPIWAENAGPLKLGPKRHHKPGINLEDLPKISLILLSHNHYDHMDLKTLKEITNRDKSFIITGLGNKNYLRHRGFKNVENLDWWEKIELLNGINIHFLPAIHFSMRNVLNRDKTLWGGFFLKSEFFSFYYAGDTAYGNFFSEIPKNLGEADFAFLPIGAYEPNWFMQTNHMNPNEALQAFKDVQAKKMIPMHFGTFQLSDEGMEDPLKELSKAAKERIIDNDDLMILKPGQIVRIKHETK